MHINRKNKNDRGYIIAEAAIILPIFLFGCVLLIYMVRMVNYQEIVHFEASKALVKMAMECESSKKSITESSFETYVNREVAKSISREISIKADVKEQDSIYEVDVKYPLKMNLPFGLFDDVEMRDVIAARKWNGGYSRGEVLGFEAMARDDDNQYVFIFPKYGERYHEGGCRYLYLFENGYIKCVTISEASSGGYTACQVCH